MVRGREQSRTTALRSSTMTSKAQATKEKRNKLDFIKMTTFCASKDTIKKVKRQPSDWERRIANHTSDRGLVSRIYKELLVPGSDARRSPRVRFYPDMAVLLKRLLHPRRPPVALGRPLGWGARPAWALIPGLLCECGSPPAPQASCPWAASTLPCTTTSLPRST